MAPSSRPPVLKRPYHTTGGSLPSRWEEDYLAFLSANAAASAADASVGNTDAANAAAATYALNREGEGVARDGSGYAQNREDEYNTTTVNEDRQEEILKGAGPSLSVVDGLVLKGAPANTCPLEEAPKTGATGTLHLVAQEEGDVPQLTKGEVEAKMEAKEPMLVVFYAPWCPHCQHFVMAGPDGTIKTAPLEQLNKVIIEKKGPTVVKLNADQPIPQDFPVKYIPAIFTVNSQSVITKYEGSTEDAQELLAFAMAAK